MPRLLKHTQYLREILNHLQEYVFLVDHDFQITYYNEGAGTNIFNGENVLGQSLFQAFPGLNQENSNIAQVFRDGQPIINKTTTYIDNDGKRRVALTSDYPLVENGVVIGVYEIAEDITGLSNLSEQILAREKRSNKNSKSQRKLGGYYTLDDFIGDSLAVTALKQQVLLYAASDANLLIYGETGTGKEVLTQAIYSLRYPDQKPPFIVQNCAAIPESLLESILFGTEKGAFTGAETRSGLLEAANGGMLFLDEINSMPQNLQPKILRVLEEGKIRKVGAKQEITVDFHLVSSTNVAPEKLLENGALRRDLFFRLNVLYLHIPPLRERVEDIPLLLNHYIRYYNHKLNRNVIGFDEAAMQLLLQYDWPGNVRELKNMVERAMHLTQDHMLHPQDIQLLSCVRAKKEPYPPQAAAASGRVRLKEALQDYEAHLLRAALEKCHNNAASAARELDIPQQTMFNKLKRHGLR